MRCRRCRQAAVGMWLLALCGAPAVVDAWSVMDQYYRIGTRVWSSGSGATKPSTFVHDPPRGGMCTAGLLSDLALIRKVMPTLFAAGSSRVPRLPTKVRAASATAQAARGWARPPCRHFKNQSC
jgi:hypothetical protein